MSRRVGLLGIHHESNTFAEDFTTLEHFYKGYLLKGSEIVREYRDAYHEIGGMLEIMEQEKVEIVPLLYAEATPGGIVSADTYAMLLKDMMQAVEAAGRLDGFLVAPHGAGVSEHHADMDGHWLSVLRKKTGPHLPLIGTLDPHANLSPLMVAATNALVAYKTNPHTDQREAGREAARLMVRTLRKEVKPRQHFFELPLAMSIEQQHTAVQPCKSLYAYARELASADGILSISILLGFPYADVREMGMSLLVISDDQPAAGMIAGELLRARILRERSKFNGEKRDICSLLPELDQMEQPVLLLDMGDNIGGGANGDSTMLMEVLERAGKGPFFICIYDPEAVRKVAEYRERERFELKIGRNPLTSNGYQCQVGVCWVKKGVFRESDPRHGGQANYDMGLTALLKTEKGNTVLLTSLRVPPFSLQQLLSFDIAPESFRMIVAKGVNAPVAAYAPVCKTVLQVDTPGVTQADMTRFNYKNRRVPLYPFENA